MPRTAVYRLFDDADNLLYVGMTNNPDERFKAHEKQKPWWHQVHGIGVQWYDTAEVAAKAEAEAIAEERPQWNRARGGGGRPATGKTPIRNFRVDNAIWDAAAEKAKAEGKTMSALVGEILDAYIAEHAAAD